MAQEWGLKVVEEFKLVLSDAIDQAVKLLVLSKPSTLPITTSSSKLNGFITISIASITKGEFTLTTSKVNRGYPIKFTVDATLQTKITQIKIARNCLEKSLHLISSLDYSPKFKNLSDPLSLDSILVVVNHILRLLKQATEALQKPDPKSIFPLANHPLLLEPSQECLADFTIKDSCKLVTTFTCLSYDKNPIEHALNQLKSIQTVKYNGKSVLVVDKIVAESTLPVLVELKDHLGKIEAICQDFIRKSACLALLSPH